MGFVLDPRAGEALDGKSERKPPVNLQHNLDYLVRECHRRYKRLCLA